MQTNTIAAIATELMALDFIQVTGTEDTEQIFLLVLCAGKATISITSSDLLTWTCSLFGNCTNKLTQLIFKTDTANLLPTLQRSLG